GFTPAALPRRRSPLMRSPLSSIMAFARVTSPLRKAAMSACLIGSMRLLRDGARSESLHEHIPIAQMRTNQELSGAGVGTWFAVKACMLSVLIETHNHEDALARTLACLVSGAVEGVVREVIVCDAGSSDRTAIVAEHAGCHFIGEGGL